jgi:precorrin-4/cobalt-precorrin-4 C11-methyltransferase
VSILDSSVPKWEKEISFFDAISENPGKNFNEDYRMGEPVRFVGAGPGDPELITVKGMRCLQNAERVVYAGSLVPETLLAYCRKDVKAFDSASLTLDQTHFLLKEGYESGERVVRLHTGDPTLYSAIREQIALLDRDNIAYEVVPGVSAAFAAAAAMHRELTIPEVSQTVILTRLAGRTPVPAREKLSGLASHLATMVIYLSVQRIEQVVAELKEHYPVQTPAAVAYRVGWPDQLLICGTLDNIAGKVRAAGIERQALILVGEAFGLDDRAENLKRSKLYDETFDHGFRNAKKPE